MFGKLWLFGVLFCVILPTSSAFAAADTISPGRSIGRIHLGDLRDNVVRQIGREPDGGDAASGQAISAWFAKGKRGSELEVWTSYYADFPDGRPNTHNRALVEQVRVTSPYFHTQTGLGVGSRWQQLAKVFPKAKQVRYFINPVNKRVDLYDDSVSGIAFEVIRQNNGSARGVCDAILVHAKGASVLSTGLWFYPHEDGKHFDESYLKPVTYAAPSVRSDDAKPYWAQPKPFWTPENARQGLITISKKADTVRIYGGGKLWQTLTGFSTDEATIKQYRLDPEAKGLIIRNKRLIRLFPKYLQYSNNRLMGNELHLAASESDALDITFSTSLAADSDDVVFKWWRGKAYCYRPSVGFLEMSSRDGARFNNFVSHLARDAKAHRGGVSFFRYNVYSLSPT